MNYKLIAYAQDFTSFLVENIGRDASKIKQVILFGSVARGEEQKDSDIDLFVDVLDQKLEGNISDITDKYYQSIKFTKYWRLLGIKSQFNCTVGKLEEWSRLKRSLIANGIVLYGKFQGTPDLKPFYLFIVTPGKNRNRNLVGWRALYGYTQKVNKKKYQKQGLVREYEGKKLGKGVFIVPAEHAQKVQIFLRRYKFQSQIIPFWSEY